MPDRTMPERAPFDPEALIDAIAPLLDIEIEPAFRPGIAANLRILTQHAARLRLDLGDEAEPAPVFEA